MSSLKVAAEYDHDINLWSLLLQRLRRVTGPDGTECMVVPLDPDVCFCLWNMLHVNSPLKSYSIDVSVYDHSCSFVQNLFKVEQVWTEADMGPTGALIECLSSTSLGVLVYGTNFPDGEYSTELTWERHACSPGEWVGVKMAAFGIEAFDLAARYWSDSSMVYIPLEGNDG